MSANLAPGVLLEVFRNRFQAIVEEMATLILRAGHTVFVTETSDFGAAIVSTGGEVIAAPVNTGVALMVGLPCDTAIARSLELGCEDGDIFLSNDVWGTGGMATHLPDIYVWKPIFHEGQIICYSWAFVHSSDVGGKVPGSISPSSSEIYQEGIRIPVTKVFKRGELNRELVEILAANCRIPDLNWGDITAMVAGLHTAERRVKDLVARYGGFQVARAIVDVLDYAEAQARAEFEKIPDGTYTYWDYLEGDSGGGRPIRLKLDMHVHGSDIVLDFSDSDPQTLQSYNLPSFSKRGHWQFVFSLVGFLKSVHPGITYNSGLARCVELKIPKGTVLNPLPGVSVGNRSATQIRLVDVIMGALAQARPDLVPAGGAGQGSIFLMQFPEVDSGRTRVTVIEPLCGGSGGRPDRDGIDGIEFAIGYLRNIPVEVIETDAPLLVHRYGYRVDSAGAGRWRGGVGLEIEVEVVDTQAVATSRAMDRYVFRPWGRLGGRAGSRGYTLLNPGAADERNIGKIDVLQLEPGDVLRIGTPGGAGYGDPLSREPVRVVEDVASGLLSATAAWTGYGVRVALVGGGWTVDEAETAAERSRRRAADSVAGAFDFGPEREAYEAVWSDEVVTTLNRLVMGLPLSVRRLARERLCRVIDERAGAGRPVLAGELAELLSAAMAERRGRVG